MDWKGYILEGPDSIRLIVRSGDTFVYLRDIESTEQLRGRYIIDYSYDPQFTLRTGRIDYMSIHENSIYIKSGVKCYKVSQNGLPLEISEDEIVQDGYTYS